MSVLRIAPVLSLLVGLLALWGCGRLGSSSSPAPGVAQRFVSKPEPWRRTEESRCLSLGLAVTGSVKLTQAAT